MLNRKVLFVVLVLLMLVPVPVMAVKPITFEDGWWDVPFYEPPLQPFVDDPSLTVPMPVIDFETEVIWRFMVYEPGVVLYGFGVQPAEFAGKAGSGTFYGQVNGEVGTCIYHLSSFSNPHNGKFKQPARASINQCTEGLAGFHMIGLAFAVDEYDPENPDYSVFMGLMTGSVHFKP